METTYGLRLVRSVLGVEAVEEEKNVENPSRKIMYTIARDYVVDDKDEIFPSCL